MHGARYAGLAGLAGAILILTGCGTQPHNNVLLFGTDTKVALDVSASAAQGGTPEITLGYKRREAVWLPLSANEFNCSSNVKDGTECTVKTAQGNGAGNGKDGADPNKFLGSAEGVDSSLGGSTAEKDAYSVFASFGAKFDSSADTKEVKAKAGLAQFFATGVAAQRLGANPRVAEALATKPPAEQAAADAKAEAQAAKTELAKTQEMLMQAVGGEKYAALAAEGKAQHDTAVMQTNLLIACAKPGDDAGKAAALLTKAKTASANQVVQTKLKRLETADKDTWAKTLKQSDSTRNALMKGYSEICIQGANNG